MAALPRCSSTREFLSLQSRSAVVIGRLIVAAAQSSTPPSCMETSPLMYLRRATRDGGSPANDITAEDATNISGKAVKANCRRIFITSPLEKPAELLHPKAGSLNFCL